MKVVVELVAGSSGVNWGQQLKVIAVELTDKVRTSARVREIHC